MEKRDCDGRPKLTVLNAAALAACCRGGHLRPSADMAPYLVIAWTLEWHLEAGKAFEQRVIADPCVHIAVDAKGAYVLGVVTGSFSSIFTGDGFVLGLKLRPAGFYPFVKRAVARYTDQRVPLMDVLPEADEE